MHFDSPWALWTLLLIPVILWLQLGRRRTGSLRFSTTRNATQVGRSLRQRFSWIPTLVRVVTLALLTVALARPQTGRERVREVSKGVAIEMVVDRSSSMGAEMEYEGQRLSRLDVVKRVFEDFVLGDGEELEGRPSDLIGMVSFARYPETACPLTLAHGALPRFLDGLNLVQTRAEDGTAIGDALALAAARLKTAEESLSRQLEGGDLSYEIKSKAIILLTDGVNNAGQRQPMQAAELAAKWGIKIYAIGIGGGEGVRTVQTLFGAYKVPTSSGMDEATLQAVAEVTSGLYRSADSADALRAVYEEIDQLERSEIEAVRYVDYKEAFLPFGLVALVLIALETALRCVTFRKAP